jgi:predicted NAD-dependent protein-ADP-ribosyltransferase YbiA (DUF1768 family)
MRSIYGQVAPDGTVPPFVTKYGANQLKNGGDCVAIMFAIHYFFENEKALNGIIQNISDSLKVGGLFVGCCFDGEKVFESLRHIPENGSLVGKEGDAELWKITKRYSKEDLTGDVDSLGLPIDVEFISIGSEQREYLVPFDLLKKKMAEIGCDLMDEKECKELGLNASTEMFETTYDNALKKGKKFTMVQDVKRYSFFNRWFIFKRRRGGMMKEVEGEVGLAEEGEKLVVNVYKKGEEAKEILEQVGSMPPATFGKEKAEAIAKDTNEEIEIVAAGKKKYELNQVFQFYIGASLTDKLGIKDVGAGRWLAPSALFPIKDKEGVIYPSLEHYLAGMKYKIATDKPELASSLFSNEGTVHQDILRKRETLSAHGARRITDEKEHELLVEEMKALKEESEKGFKKYKAKFDEGKWLANKDKVLEDGLRQRYERDERLRRIIEAAKTKKIYLLYYTQSSGSELGGKRLADKTIDGENKIGNLLMKFANFSGM